MNAKQLKSEFTTQQRSILSLAEYLGLEVQKVGSCYRLKSDNSVILDPRKNTFNDFGRTARGGDVIEFIKYAQNCGNSQAISTLSSYLAIPETKNAAIFSYHSNNQPIKADFAAEWRIFEPLTFNNEKHKAELLAIAPLELYKQADKQDITKFLEFAKYDRVNKTIAAVVKDNSGKIVGYKRRRYKMGTELVKWAARKNSSIHHCTINVNSGNNTIYIVEGLHDSLTAILMGLDFIGIPTATYNRFTQYELDIIKGREVVFIPDNDSAGAAAVNRLLSQVKQFAKAISVFELPEQSKDFTEYIFKLVEKAKPLKSWKDCAGFTKGDHNAFIS
jgi:hypothetical protein